MKLGGWARLWIVASVIYFCIVTGFSVMAFPMSARIKHNDDFYEKLSPGFRELLILPQKEGGPVDLFEAYHIRPDPPTQLMKMPNEHVLIFMPKTPKTKQQDVARAYWEIVVATANRRQMEFVIKAILAWAGPVSFLFIFGWSIGWVRAGFQKRNNS